MTNDIDIDWFRGVCDEYIADPEVNPHPFVVLCRHYDNELKIRAGSPEASCAAMQAFIELSVASAKEAGKFENKRGTTMNEEENQVNEFLVENFVKLKLGTLDEEEVQRLEELGDDWQQHAEDLICESAFAKILRTDAKAHPWEDAVQIVANRINEDIRAMA